MDPQTWERIASGFARVRQAAPADRERVLAELDVEIRGEVESLLAAQDAAGGFLEYPDARGFGRGVQLGPYRILREIGSGGMGVVYLAERSDGEFHREVAIKVTGGRLFGPEAERRFIRERQILAQLNHPNIVRMLDGGVADGRRYIVMEYIGGEPLNQYARSLSLRERLRLFVDVCGAVQYAHQRMILHRDLKPANVLVSTDGVVKLLDFGVAQLLDIETGTNGHDTVLHPITIAYASPEQLRGEPMTLSSDIYSLGVLLYEVITGRNPQYAENTAYTELVRRVTEVDPPAPSKADPAIPADVSAIIMKALAKRARDRYASAAELEDDIERFLKGRAVLAVPPRPWYVARRFVARNRAFSAAIGALVLLTMASSAFFYRQSRIEARHFASSRELVTLLINEVEPELENMGSTMPLREKLVQGTIQYLQALLKDSPDDPALFEELARSHLQMARLQGNAFLPNRGKFAAAREELLQAERSLQRAQEIAPGARSLPRTAAMVYAELAAHETQNAKRDGAAGHASRAVQYAEQAVAAAPEDWQARRLLAQSLYYYGAALTPAPEAMDKLARSVTLFRELSEERPAEDAPLINLLLADWRMAEVASARGDFDSVVSHSRTGLATAERLIARNPELQRYRLFLSSANIVLARGLLSKGDAAQALPLAERALAIRERIFLADSGSAQAQERLADAHLALANAHVLLGKFAQAETVARRSVELYSQLASTGRLAPNFRIYHASAFLNLARALAGLGKQAEACQAARESVALFDQAMKRMPANKAVAGSLAMAQSIAGGCGK